MILTNQGSQPITVYDHLTNCSVIQLQRQEDGTWKDVFREARDLDNPPAFVVVSRLADERLWAEVLNLGGFDVLLKPFVRSEVVRVMGMALRHWENAPAYAM